MRYQAVWLSLRKMTIPSSRIFERCCDNADWLMSAASTSEPTVASPYSTNLHRIIRRRSLASTLSIPATSLAFR